MKKYFIIAFLFFLFSKSSAQDIVEGIVKAAENNMPLSAVTITTNGIPSILRTDKEGRFKFKRQGDTIKIKASFLGFDDGHLVVSDPINKPLEIFLTTIDQQISEVLVSTGYQNIPKERSTGSFVVINKSDLEQQFTTNVFERLESLANGYSIYRDRGNQTRMMIRGMSTIQGVTKPLIVVDNFPYEGDLDNINPNDIESITLLKDAAAASIWGTRAGNGVIVVTTKKGKFNQPINLSFNTNVTSFNIPNLYYQKDISGSDFIEVERFLYEKGFYNSQINSPSKPALTPVLETLINGGNDVERRIDELKQIDVRDEYLKYLYQRGFKQQYSISMDGGTNILSWLFSAGLDKNINETNGKYNRYNIRYSNTFIPIANLSINTGIYFTQSNAKNGRPSYGSISTSMGKLYPYAQFADREGVPLSIMRDLRQSYIDADENKGLLDWNYYPLEDYKNVNQGNKIQDIVLNFGINYKLSKDLNVDFKYLYEEQSSANRSVFSENSYMSRNMINTFSSLDKLTGKIINKVPYGAIMDDGLNLLKSQQLRGQLSYDKTTGIHQISAIAGAEIRDNKLTGNSTRVYGLNEDLLTFGNVDYTTPYETWVTGNKAFIPQNSGLYERQNRFVSIYGNAAYTFSERYTLSGSARRDASNLFGVNTNDKWTPLWSAGAAWNISNENFFISSMFTQLKLRATYGFSGNVDQGKAAVTTMQYVINSPYTLKPYGRFSNYSNPDLKWERVATLNLGIDFSLKNNIVSGSLEYFEKTGKDLFGAYPVDYTAIPVSSVVRNLAAMKANGFDVSLQSKNIQRKIKWTSDVNFNFYKDIVTEYYLNSTKGSDFLGGGAQFAGVEGKPVYALFSYYWAGLDPETGDPQGYFQGEVSKNYSSLTGASVTVHDLKYNGPVLPRYTAIIGNTLSWKNLYVNIKIAGKFGYVFKRNSISYSALFNSRDGHSDYSLRWQNPGDELRTTIPSMVYPAVSNRDSFYKNAEILIEKGDHIRVQYITLGYDLHLPKQPFKRLLLNFNVNNVGILWRENKHNLDPDYYLGSIPSPTSFTFGIKGSL